MTKGCLNISILGEQINPIQTREQQKVSKCGQTEIRRKSLENLKCLGIRLHYNLDNNVFDKHFKAEITLV